MKRGPKKRSSTKRSRRSSTITKTTNNSTSMDNMKYEIASEFGVHLGPDSTSRANGRVGGEITKRLVDKGKNK